MKTMPRVITFSQTFPAYHPEKGTKTHFVEQFLNSIGKKIDETYWDELVYLNKKLNKDILISFYESLDQIDTEKIHTIRGSHNRKEGEYFSPRVWSGKPRFSPQITFAPDTKIVKTYSFSKEDDSMYRELPFPLYTYEIEQIAKNDGLCLQCFLDWFSKDIDGQIICWKDPKY